MNFSLHQNFDITKTNIINHYELLKNPQKSTMNKKINWFKINQLIS